MKGNLLRFPVGVKARSSWATLVETGSPDRLLADDAEQAFTTFSHEVLIGVRCRSKRGRSSSQALTLG